MFPSECQAAAQRIAPYVRHTPVEYSHVLSEVSGARVHLKLENLQITGSFKLRGATNALLSLGDEVTAVVAASSGNHGVALAHAARIAGVAALIFVPEAADPSKLEAIEALGAGIMRVEGDPVLAEAAARRHAVESGVPYISPYNDPHVVAGQGTLGVELAKDLERIDVLFASLGGGGLISGVGGYLKAGSRHACGRLLASEFARDARVAAGRAVFSTSRHCPRCPTARRAAWSPGAITFGLCQEVVDDSLTVSEDEIRVAMRLIIGRHHTLIEGSAAVAVAGFLQTIDRWDRAGRRDHPVRRQRGHQGAEEGPLIFLLS